MRTRCGVALLATLALALSGCLAGVAGGSDSLLSKSEERKIGRQVLDEVERNFRFLDDPYLTGYLDEIGARLGRAADVQEFELDFHVVADPRINAFAVPGGHIFLTSQTVLACEDESELAGVVAHEMGHAEGRHLAHRMQKASRVNLAALAAVLAGAFLGGSPEAGAAMGTFALAGAQTKMLKYSRTDEEAADRWAVRSLRAADYDGWGLVRFMETLRKDHPAPEGIPAYLFTHPLPANRASYLADALPPPDPGRREEPGTLWRAQARVLVQDGRRWGPDLFRQRVEEHPESADARLGLALLLRSQGQYDDALAALEEARRLAPLDREIRHEIAATRLRAGQVPAAIRELEALRADGAATVPSLRDLGWAYLERDQGEKALAVYDELAERDPDWKGLAYHRGMALGKAGRPGDAHATLGDYYRETGDPKLARRHYRAALEALPPGERRDAVEARLREVEDAL